MIEWLREMIGRHPTDALLLLVLLCAIPAINWLTDSLSPPVKKDWDW